MRLSFKRVMTVLSVVVLAETLRLLVDDWHITRQKISKKVIKNYVNKNQLDNRRTELGGDEETVKGLNTYKEESVGVVGEKSSENELSAKNTQEVSNVVSVCSDTAVKKILWYDIYHNNHGIRNKAKIVDFEACECKCILDFFTFNDTGKTYGPLEADGVLMQLNKLRGMSHPPLKGNNQVFVVLEREATPGRKLPISNFQNVVNWTMTYRLDSDIYYPYGRITLRTERPALPKDYTQIFKRKKKSIVWFVSHCKTRNRREEYVKELRKYIDVDIYGECGTLQCARHGKRSQQCNENIADDYFFRIAFENTYHRDYVTEKLFEHFPLDMVQIVLGSADYTKIVPEGTVIDVKNFSTPKALAEYLKQLMKSEEEYTKFLKMKENYYAETLAEQSQKAYCQLCFMLHNPEKYKKMYSNLAEWWLS